MTYRVRVRKAPDIRIDRFAWTDEEAEELFGSRVVKGYDPNQPRHPKGHPLGGQWVGTGGGSGTPFLTDTDGRRREFPEGTSMYDHMVQRSDGSWALTPERQAMHDRIVKEIIGDVQPPEGQPEFYMTGGGPASGKSTMLEAGSVHVPDETRAVTINADHVKELMPDYQRGLKEGNPNIAGIVHDESSLISQKVRQAVADRGLNAIYDTTGNGHVEELASTVGLFRAAGYRTTAYYASLDTKLAEKINYIRYQNTGRLVPPNILRKTHANVSRGFLRYASHPDMFDEFRLYDTNIQHKPRLVAQGGRGRIEVVNRSLFARFLRKGQTSDGTLDFGPIEVLPDPVQVRREEADEITTHQMATIVKEIVLGLSPDQSSLEMTAELRALWEETEDEIAKMPEDAIIDPGDEYDPFDFSPLYDSPEKTTKSTGVLVDSEKWVRIKQVDNEKQIVYGEVYAPGQLDTFGEFMTADDIEIMAHRFMQLDLRAAIDTQHDNIPNGAYPVESFIARKGDPDYTENSWVLGVKIPDENLWLRVKSGELNGFSFQSLVRPAEIEVDYDVTRDHVGKTESQHDHTHAYYVELDEVGNVVRGITSRAADGHFHEIERASVTEADNGHSHRFFL